MVSAVSHEQVERLSSAIAFPSLAGALAGEQNPSRRWLALGVVFTAQTAVLCLLQGEGGNCIEIVLSAASAWWTAVCNVLPRSL